MCNLILDCSRMTIFFSFVPVAFNLSMPPSSAEFNSRPFCRQKFPRINILATLWHGIKTSLVSFPWIVSYFFLVLGLFECEWVSYSVVSWSLWPPWTVAQQASLSKKFSRKESWNRYPLPSPGDLPELGVKPGSLALQVDSSRSEHLGRPWHCLRIHKTRGTLKYLHDSTQQRFS